jgi:hypothetical protein
MRRRPVLLRDASLREAPQDEELRDGCCALRIARGPDTSVPRAPCRCPRLRLATGDPILGRLFAPEARDVLDRGPWAERPDLPIIIGDPLGLEEDEIGIAHSTISNVSDPRAEKRAPAAGGLEKGHRRSARERIDCR